MFICRSLSSISIATSILLVLEWLKKSESSEIKALVLLDTVLMLRQLWLFRWAIPPSHHISLASRWRCESMLLLSNLCNCKKRMLKFVGTLWWERLQVVCMCIFFSAWCDVWYSMWLVGIILCTFIYYLHESKVDCLNFFDFLWSVLGAASPPRQGQVQIHFPHLQLHLYRAFQLLTF